MSADAVVVRDSRIMVHRRVWRTTSKPCSGADLSLVYEGKYHTKAKP